MEVAKVSVRGTDDRIKNTVDWQDMIDGTEIRVPYYRL